MTDQLPAIIEPTALPAPADTYIVPALITDAGGDQAGWRYVEFFTAKINNDHTRWSYARGCSRFSPDAKITGCRSPPFSRSTSRRGSKSFRRKHGAGGQATVGGRAYDV
jgi:hypothetical protein